MGHIQITSYNAQSNWMQLAILCKTTENPNINIKVAAQIVVYTLYL